MASQVSRRTLLTAAGVSLLFPAVSPAADNSLFVPAFEFQNWLYQSFLILPTDSEIAAKPGSDVTSKKWAMGKLVLADSVDGYTAHGQLTFAPGVGLEVRVTFTPGKDGSPAAFSATGTGVEGVTKGSEYQLTGWAIPGADGKVASVRGSVMAVRGPEGNPMVELGGMPVGTVGAFTITKAS